MCIYAIGVPVFTATVRIAGSKAPPVGIYNSIYVSINVYDSIYIYVGIHSTIYIST